MVLYLPRRHISRVLEDDFVIKAVELILPLATIGLKRRLPVSASPVPTRQSFPSAFSGLSYCAYYRCDPPMDYFSRILEIGQLCL
jgi:hypothetical protein